MIGKMADAHDAQTHEMMAVVFELKKPDAVSVCLAGSFNAWNAEASPLTRGYGGVWTITTHLAPGDYEYCLVVDGRWILDPANQVSVANPFGGRNSLLAIRGSPAAGHLIDAEHQLFRVSRKNGPVGVLNTDGGN